MAPRCVAASLVTKAEVGIGRRRRRRTSSPVKRGYRNVAETMIRVTSARITTVVDRPLSVNGCLLRFDRLTIGQISPPDNLFRIWFLPSLHFDVT